MLTNESQEYNVTIHHIEEKIQNFNQRGSNWNFGESYHWTLTSQTIAGPSNIKLPKFIADKKVVINLKNKDNDNNRATVFQMVCNEGPQSS